MGYAHGNPFMTASTQRREFRLDRHALTSIIQAQAGSLHKALLEAVANALDAGASRVKVDLTPTRVVIEDDGKGFSSMEEIESFFENFGFDHSQLDRKVGRFGVGRGQLFNFGRNLWTTHGFTMSIDHRQDGFGYDLGKAKKAHKGVKIEIDLYDPLSFSELSAAETEFRKVVKYSTIPVMLNGKEVQKSPESVKWDAETNEAWFLFDDSYQLKVYSQGLFVQDIYASRYGKGGVVVTKLGQALTQNMARNDLLTSSCPVWKKVDKELKRLAASHQDKAKKSKVLTEPMRAALAKLSLHQGGVEGFDALFKTPLFTLANGKHVKLEQLLSTGFVAAAAQNDPAADLLIQRKQAQVITNGTLHRFGVETVEDLAQALNRAVIARHAEFKDYHTYDGQWEDRWKRSKTVRELREAISQCKFFEKVSDLPMQANVSFSEVKPSEYSPEEKMMMGLVRREMLPWVARIVSGHLSQEGASASSDRTVALAVGEGFAACTDGHSRVWIERKFLRDCVRSGPAGFVAMANTLVHELLHDVDTSSGHTHDQAFFEAYHDLTINGSISSVAMNQYRSFLRRGGKASSYSVKEMEGAGLLDADDAQARLDSLRNKGQAEPEPVELAEPAVAAPKPRRRKLG